MAATASSKAKARAPGRPKGEQVENTARRRKQLIDAAIASIVERGLSATTLASVAAAAGLSQGSAVFYFKSKENLLLETLRQHYEDYNAAWRDALAAAGDDPVDQLAALVFSDVDEAVCTPTNMALWSAFWGEAAARPRFGELCEHYDQIRYDAMLAVCEDAARLVPGDRWTAVAIADLLDAITDGMWTRMHVSPDFMDHARARGIIARALAMLFPDRAGELLDRA